MKLVLHAWASIDAACFWCRNMSEQHRKEAEAHRRRADEAQVQNEPLRRHNRELQAFKDSHEQEIQIVSALLPSVKSSLFLCCAVSTAQAL